MSWNILLPCVSWVLLSHSRYRYFADKFLCQNTRMLLYDWRRCNTQAKNLGYYALLSSLNPLSVFDFLMNLRRFMWQAARQYDWKTVILYSSILSPLCSANQTWGHSLVDHCDSGTTAQWHGNVLCKTSYKLIMLSPTKCADCILKVKKKPIGFMNYMYYICYILDTF